METWILNFNDWDPKEEGLRETLLTLGNGYFATRGAAEESRPDQIHYPGTYLGGGYNRLITEIQEKNIENEDLVNWPNWLALTFRHPGEEWFSLNEASIISYIQELNMKRGELIRTIHFKDFKSRETKLRYERIVSMDNPHIGAIRLSIEPQNWSSALQVKSSIDVSIVNGGVHRYKKLNKKHFNLNLKSWIGRDCFLIETVTSQSRIFVSQAIRNEIFHDGNKIEVNSSQLDESEEMGLLYELNLECGIKTVIEKTMTLFTSKDKSCTHPAYEAERLLKRLPSYDSLFRDHFLQWQRLWRLCDLELLGNKRETRLLRLHIFHLLQTVSFKSIDMDVGVPARGLHGEAYRGHIFWDELFILPFLNLRIPELSRSLLLYRYRRLDEARINARDNGFLGAMYPWQSGSNGEEESQVLHLNPLSVHWIPDTTYKQRHLNAAILYNIWHYFETTGDKQFLSHYGVEMGLEISRFWISCLEFNLEKGKYEICKVVGPDEFHTHYPNSENSGINNNAYTNYMASWCIRTSIEMLLSLSQDRQLEILQLLDLTHQELAEWLEKSKKIFLPLQKDGIINQFEGFENLKDLDWDNYRKKYGNIQRIDRILEAEGDNVNYYKVNKQADVLMLFYLFSLEELEKGFQWLGYKFKQSWIKKNINYHLNISTNGSSLSRIVHSWVLSRLDPEKSWEWFIRALESDISDIASSTTSEGIHLGAMAGTLDLVQRCFTGIDVRQGVLQVRPHLPRNLSHLRSNIHFKGNVFELNIFQDSLHIKVKRTQIHQGKIRVQGKMLDFKQGEEFEFRIAKDQKCK